MNVDEAEEIGIMSEWWQLEQSNFYLPLWERGVKPRIYVARNNPKQIISHIIHFTLI